MAKEIRTRDAHADVKVLDRAAINVTRVKNASVKTKDKINEVGKEPDEASPEEYAFNKMTNGMERGVSDGVYQTRKTADRVKHYIKTREKPTKEPVAETKFPSRTEVKVKDAENISVKTVEVKQKNTVKTKDSQSIKTNRHKIRTSEKTNHVKAKKMTEVTKDYQASMKALAKSKDKAKEATRRTAAASKRMVVRAGKAIAASIKAIIAAFKSLIASLGVGGFIAALVLIVVVLFGGALSFIGGGNANAVQPVSAEVEAYTPLIRQYANQYGIPEYVELIKAVMMQESGGRGLDPMQSSEGSYNTRYPRKPNGITDPEYSIQCGVQELKAALDSAEVESPVDMEHIKLALQGYNFGNGYIPWAKSNYGGYSLANATEFSDMKAAELGWSNYGDKLYVPHVLRYYPFGRIPTGIGNQAIVQVALSQEGNVGGQPYWSWYGFTSRVEWCACFVSWCAEQCGYIDAGVIPKFSLCSDGVRWFDQRGRFKDGSYVPASGDIIFFDWGANGDVDHVGIVEYVQDGRVYTIEGNSGDMCRRRSYVIGNNTIYGYGVYYTMSRNTIE